MRSSTVRRTAPPAAEALVRQRVADWAKALHTKDLEGVMSLYAPSIVSFDIVPPLRYAGADNKRRAWQEAFAAYTGPITYDVRDLTVATQGDLAFVHSLNHLKGALPSGQMTDMWVALDGVLPANRWRLADRARPRVSASRPRAWPGRP